nr:PREDICTED: GATS-like protein 2 [Latimeria chalumnae]|eukprot:XP_006013298.2 PREDICTED: GATS-like protein 2 [Latimeria chalumnae]
MDLHILDHKLKVTSISREGFPHYTHCLIKLLFLRNRTRCKFFSLTETPDDYTVVLDEEGFKDLHPTEFLQVADATWLALNVVSNGSLTTGSQTVGVTKITKSVIAPLAEHSVSVFLLSTYQTDFILVRKETSQIKQDKKKAPGFQHCVQCFSPFPATDKHECCLKCLGSDHRPRDRELCWAMGPRALRNREQRLRDLFGRCCASLSPSGSSGHRAFAETD